MSYWLDFLLRATIITDTKSMIVAMVKPAPNAGDKLGHLNIGCLLTSEKVDQVLQYLL